jgi:hypothetical protein
VFASDDTGRVAWKPNWVTKGAAVVIGSDLGQWVAKVIA